MRHWGANKRLKVVDKMEVLSVDGIAQFWQIPSLKPLWIFSGTQERDTSALSDLVFTSSISQMPLIQFWFWQNLRRTISPLHSSIQNYPDWPIGELQLHLKNKVPCLLLIGPGRVFIIPGGWGGVGGAVHCCLVETWLERQPTVYWSHCLFVPFGFKKRSLLSLLRQVFSVGILLGYRRHEYNFSSPSPSPLSASTYTVKYAVSPDHCREFLESLVGLLDFILWPTSGTFDIYSAPGREVCRWLLTRQKQNIGAGGYTQVTVAGKKAWLSADNGTRVVGQMQTAARTLRLLHVIAPILAVYTTCSTRKKCLITLGHQLVKTSEHLGAKEEDISDLGRGGDQKRSQKREPIRWKICNKNSQLYFFWQAVFYS